MIINEFGIGNLIKLFRGYLRHIVTYFIKLLQLIINQRSIW